MEQDKTLINLPTSVGDIIIEVDLKETPKAAQLFTKQLASAYGKVNFKYSRNYISLGPFSKEEVGSTDLENSGTLEHTSLAQSFSDRGSVAFSKRSPQVVLISRGYAAYVPHGLVFGKIKQPRSLRLVEEIANMPANSVYLKPPRKSQQLKDVLDFEQRLRKYKGMVNTHNSLNN